MSNTIKVSDLRLVEFPAGYLRSLGSGDERHIAWVRRYTMVIPKGRGGISFSTPDFQGGTGAVSDPFARAALRRCLSRALELGPGEAIDDDARTGISIRRVGKSTAFELDMPCGENACIKQAVLARLVKELDNV